MFASLASIPAGQAHAAEIRYDESTRVFELSAQQVTYAFGVNERGELQSLYWGGRRAPVTPCLLPNPMQGCPRSIRPPA